MQTGTVTTGYHWLAPSATDQIHLPSRQLANLIFTATTAFSALNHSDFGKSSILSSRIFLVWSGSVCLAAVTQPSIDTRCVPPDKSSLVSLPSLVITQFQTGWCKWPPLPTLKSFWHTFISSEHSKFSVSHYHSESIQLAIAAILVVASVDHRHFWWEILWWLILPCACTTD